MAATQHKVIGLLVTVAALAALAPACSGAIDAAPTAADASADVDGGDAAIQDSPHDAARAPCSTGPAHLDTDQFPFAYPFDEPKDHDCLPRCEYNRGKVPLGLYYIDALPSGDCSVEAERCSMPVMHTCCHGAAMGPQLFFRCVCTSGQWACGIVAQTNGGCAEC